MTALTGLFTDPAQRGYARTITITVAVLEVVVGSAAGLASEAGPVSAGAVARSLSTPGGHAPPSGRGRGAGRRCCRPP